MTEALRSVNRLYSLEDASPRADVWKNSREGKAAVIFHETRPMTWEDLPSFLQFRHLGRLQKKEASGLPGLGDDKTEAERFAEDDDGISGIIMD